MIRRPPRSTQSRSSAASDVYKRQGEHRGDGDALLLAAAERVRRPVEHLFDAQLLRSLAHAALDLLARQAELQRAEGQLVVGVGAEELDVGLLKDEADARAEVPAVRRVLERVRGERRAERADGAARGEDEPVEHLQ